MLKIYNSVEGDIATGLLIFLYGILSFDRMDKCIFLTIVFFTLVLSFSCGNREKSKELEHSHEKMNTAIGEEPLLPPIWTYSVEDTLQYWGRDDTVDHSLRQLIAVVNAGYARSPVKIDSVDWRNDTVFVKIDSAEYLTSRMGSAGAREYLAVATFTLTEAAGAKYVCFEFEEGDHAAPGVYDRAYFQKNER